MKLKIYFFFYYYLFYLMRFNTINVKPDAEEYLQLIRLYM